MYYTVYKELNKINGNFYIGAHKTTDLGDNYRGSGKLITRAIKTHGVDKFDHIILLFCRNEQEMYNEEYRLIQELKPVYNIHEGGRGGFKYVNDKVMTYEKRSEILGKYVSRIGKSYSDHLKSNSEFASYISETISSNMKSYYESGGLNGMQNKEHSEDTRKKMSSTHKRISTGSGNNMYGKIRVKHVPSRTNRVINSEDLDSYLEAGWVRGFSEINKILDIFYFEGSSG